MTITLTPLRDTLPCPRSLSPAELLYVARSLLAFISCDHQASKPQAEHTYTSQQGCGMTGGTSRAVMPDCSAVHNSGAGGALALAISMPHAACLPTPAVSVAAPATCCFANYDSHLQSVVSQERVWMAG